MTRTPLLPPPSFASLLFASLLFATPLFASIPFVSTRAQAAPADDDGGPDIVPRDHATMAQAMETSSPAANEGTAPVPADGKTPAPVEATAPVPADGTAPAPDEGTAPAQPLTLLEAQAEARANAPEVGEWDAWQEDARAAVDEASRVLRSDPQFSIIYKPLRFSSDPIEHLWDASLSMPVDISGSRKLRTGSARKSQEQLTLTREAQLCQLDEWVARAVADVALLQRAERRAARLARLAQESCQVAEQHFAAKRISQLDLDTAHLDRIFQETAHLDNVLQLEQARARLARLLGRTAFEGLAVEDDFVPPVLPPAPDVDKLLEGNLRVLAAQAELQAAELQLKTLERLVWPAPTLGVSYGRGMEGYLDQLYEVMDSAVAEPLPYPELAFTLSIGLPIFDRLTQPRNQTSARVRASRARLRTVRADTRLEIETAWATLRATIETLNTYRDVPEIIERDIRLAGQMSGQGTLSPGVHSQLLRLLEDAASRFEEAVRQVRYAQATWRRLGGTCDNQ